MHPGSTVDSIQKKSNKTQFLYRQLCHIHKELSLLGPSGFPTPHSYSQALQQVQRMKGFLEDQLFTSNSVNLNEVTQKKYNLHTEKTTLVDLHVLVCSLKQNSAYCYSESRECT